MQIMTLFCAAGGYTGGEMASPPARRAAAPPGPPAFSDRAQAGVLLGAALRDALGKARPSAAERMRALPGSVTRPDDSRGDRPRVFALPRGGVPVAAGVADAVGASLGVLMVRKIGHPAAPELGLGAIAEDGRGGAAEPYFDAEMLATVGLTVADLAVVVARERAELARRLVVYGRRGPDGGPGLPAASVAPCAPHTGSGPGTGDAGEAGGPDGDAPGRDLAGELVIVVDDGLATGVTARAALRAVRARGAAWTVLAVPVAAPSAAEAIKKETDEVVTLVTPRRFRSVGEWYVDFGQLTDADVLTILSSWGTPAPA
jgi:putative phosphoribosyl transferase